MMIQVSSVLPAVSVVHLCIPTRGALTPHPMAWVDDCGTN